MNTMQAFYDRLVSIVDSENPYLSLMAKLTQIQTGTISALKSVLGWGYWSSEAN